MTTWDASDYPLYTIKVAEQGGNGVEGPVVTFIVSSINGGEMTPERQDMLIRDILSGLNDRGYLVNANNESNMKITLDESDPPEEVAVGLFDYLPKTFRYRYLPPPE